MDVFGQELPYLICGEWVGLIANIIWFSQGRVVDKVVGYHWNILGERGKGWWIDGEKFNGHAPFTRNFSTA